MRTCPHSPMSGEKFPFRDSDGNVAPVRTLRLPPLPTRPSETLTYLSGLLTTPVAEVERAVLGSPVAKNSSLAFLSSGDRWVGWSGWLPLSEKYYATVCEWPDDAKMYPPPVRWWQSTTFLHPDYRGRGYSKFLRSPQRNIFSQLVSPASSAPAGVRENSGARFVTVVKKKNVAGVGAFTSYVRTNPWIVQRSSPHSCDDELWWEWVCPTSEPDSGEKISV